MVSDRSREALLLSAGLAAILVACASVRGPLDVVIRGRITDKSAHPISGARVVLPEQHVAATSDDSGAFRFAATVPAGRLRVRVLFIGFDAAERRLNVRRRGEVDLGTITLTQRPMQVEDLYVTAVPRVPPVPCVRAAESPGIVLLDSVVIDHPIQADVVRRIAVAAARGLDTIPGLWTAAPVLRSAGQYADGFAFDSVGRLRRGFRFHLSTGRMDTIPLPHDLVWGTSDLAISPGGTWWAWVAVRPGGREQGMLGRWPCARSGCRPDQQTPLVAADTSQSAGVCWINGTTVRFEIPERDGLVATFVGRPGRSEWRAWSQW